MSEKEKWHWKMDYCLKHKLPAAQSWAWNQAEEAYNIALHAKNLKEQGNE